MCYMPPCWFFKCPNKVPRPKKCDHRSDKPPCDGWNQRIGEPAPDFFCAAHESFKPPTPASHKPKDSKHPTPHPGAYPKYQAQYLDAGNSGQAQSYSGSALPEAQSYQLSDFTDAFVPTGPYSSVVGKDGTISTHSIPGGLYATGPIPNPLPPLYVDEDMTSNNPYASSSSNNVPPAAPSFAGPHQSSHRQSSHHRGLDKQARYGSQSSRSYEYQ